ncbi:MAG: hypothetical protein JWL95_940 [Gemmatimonadetes bacterium]|nr:hypothetical protein [Gemmatimonadota bacterium]
MRPAIGRFAMLLALALVTSCDNADPTRVTGGGGPDPSNGKVTVAVTGAPASVPAGSSATATATITRANGYLGAVELSVEGLPTAVTASASPSIIPASGTTSVITFVVGATAAAGGTNVTIRAKGFEIPDATTSVSLFVTAKP